VDWRSPTGAESGTLGAWLSGFGCCAISTVSCSAPRSIRPSAFLTSLPGTPEVDQMIEKPGMVRPSNMRPDPWLVKSKYTIYCGKILGRTQYIDKSDVFQNHG
jgi:hypothetical protein